MNSTQNDGDMDWQELPLELRHSIAAAWRLSVPAAATALYGRWWQLESWLRSLVYVELRAAFGPTWADELHVKSAKRQDADQSIQHMVTADSQSRLAYSDASVLFSIIDKHWNLFESALFAKGIWTGRAEELRHIRNRIGHCRRPHSDDLARLEQTLRDLEAGAFTALSAFNRQYHPDKDWNDPIVSAWIRREHGVAIRLIDHADKQYETSFDLYCSRRPWGNPFSTASIVSGNAGYVWHARWFFRDSRWLDLNEFWNSNFSKLHREAMLFVTAIGPHWIEVSFSAMENSTVVADAIGSCFDVILMGLRHDERPDHSSWVKRHANLDPRVQAGGPWSIVSDSTTPISIFGAYASS